MRESDLDKLVERSFDQLFRNFGFIDRIWTEYVRDASGRQLALQNGMPDFSGCLLGRHIEIEDKVYPNGPKSSQWARGKRVNRQGGVYIFIVSTRDGVMLVPPEYIIGSEKFSYSDVNRWERLKMIGQILDLSPITKLVGAINVPQGR